MHLLIDGQTLQTPNARRGIGRYTANLIAGLRRTRPGWRVELALNAVLDPVPAGLADGLTVRAFEPPDPAAGAAAAVNELVYADWLAASGADAVLLTDLFNHLLTAPRFTGPRPALYTVLYDLIPLLFAERFRAADWFRDHYGDRLRAALGCDGLLAISDATAGDWRRLAGPGAPPACNVAGAVDPAFAPLPDEDLPAWRHHLGARFGLGGEFVLFVGGGDPRKNMEGSVRAFAALPPALRGGLELVIACVLDPATRAGLGRLAAGLGVADRLRLTGYVSDGELRALYHLCRVFFFPSLYEGLGLPVLEALVCGAPVVAGDNSSLPEYAGPVSWLADAADPAALAAALASALLEPRDLRRAARVDFARSFRWDDTAERAAGVIGRKNPSPGPSPKRGEEIDRTLRPEPASSLAPPSLLGNGAG